MKNQSQFPPNINPQLYSLAAVVVGAAIVDDFSAPEQNSIGNWLMLVSQYIITHAAQQNLIDNRLRQANMNYNNLNNEIDYLINAVKKIQRELEKIKNEY